MLFTYYCCCYRIVFFSLSTTQRPFVSLVFHHLEGSTPSSPGLPNHHLPPPHSEGSVPASVCPKSHVPHLTLSKYHPTT